MVGRFDDDFVRADAADLVVQPVSLAVQFAFDAQRGEFIGDDAQAPLGWIARSVASEYENLRRRLAFIARAERADAASLRLERLAHEIRRALGSIRRNNDPSSRNRVFTQFRHVFDLLADAKSSIAGPQTFFMGSARGYVLSVGVVLRTPARGVLFTLRLQRLRPGRQTLIGRIYSGQFYDAPANDMPFWL